MNEIIMERKRKVITIINKCGDRLRAMLRKLRNFFRIKLQILWNRSTFLNADSSFKKTILIFMIFFIC